MRLSLRRSLSRLWQLRSAIRALQAIDQRLAEQNRLLQRLADQFAPVPPAEEVDAGRSTPTAAELSYLDPVEIACVQDFQVRYFAATGRDPSDELILEHLAEQKAAGWTDHLNRRARR